MKTLMKTPTSTREPDTQHPVIVIGGGIAGITAAWELQQQGVPVVLIESTPHLGGRIDSRDGPASGRLETGMQFYYSSYRETNRLLKRFDLHKDLVPIHVRGLIAWQDRIKPFSKTWPWLSHLSVKENLWLQASVARQLFPLLRMCPFDFQAGDPLDRIDVAEYALRHGNEAVLEVAFRPLVNSYAFCEPEGHSLAMLLRIIKLGAFGKTYGLRAGNDSLPKAMARELEVIHARVTDIVIERGKVESVVIDRDGRSETLPASAVVCAVRAPQAASLLGSAPEMAEAMRALSYSSVILANLHLDRPLEGKDWCYVLSRKAGHQAAFAIDLLRRAPEMFPGGRSVIQVDFAAPVSDRLMAHSDDDICDQAIRDMHTFHPEIAEWVTHTSVVRRPRVLPNFRVGMFDQVRAIQDMAAGIGGLHLAGDYLRAPLCEGAVRSAKTCVEDLMGSLSRA